MRFAMALLAAAVTLAIPSQARQRGVDRQYMKPGVSPCADFYEYANGAWLDTVRISSAFPFAGVGLEIYQRNEALLREVLEGAATRADRERDPTLHKLGVLYAALMDSGRADREGLAPLRERLEGIAAIASRADLQRMFVSLQEEGAGEPFELTANPDSRNSARNIAVLAQGGLGLPDRDFYFRSDPQSDSLRRAYVAYVARMLTLSGTPRGQAGDEAVRVMTLETALAESSLTAVELRDPEATDLKVAVRELRLLAPEVDWIAFFRSAGLPRLTLARATLVVEEPSFVRQLGTRVARTPLETWRAYLRFHTVDDAASWLGRDLFGEWFGFHRRLTGQRVPAPRWRIAIQTADQAMGEALGKAFVARAFPPEARARAREMVENLRAVFDERIAGLDWMSDSTKIEARRKLSLLVEKIGYPDRWRDYSRLEIDASLPAWEDLRRARAFEQRRIWDRIDRPVDRAEWLMTPATLNAYYNASNNEIVFPAAFLQPPHFDPANDDAINYGAAGAVIGHEMTHGFDDEGRKFDARGNLRNWWIRADERRFLERAQKVVDEYDGFVAIDTLHVNGRLTLGENIADQGGLTLAYYAYERSLAAHGRRDIDGLTPEQRFFIAYAQSRRAVWRPELIRTEVLSDPHAPDRWRVDGAVSNMPEFRRAFGCHDGDPMVRSDRAGIW